jgi:enamine deaminase RidA (YjgF/YER057c/UK114 family)
MKLLAGLASLAVVFASSAVCVHAGEIVRSGRPDAPISGVVVVKDVGGMDFAYASGVPGSAKAGPDTKTQTIDSLTKLIANLKAQGFGAGDIVMMRVYLVGDPTMGGKMDFTGMMAGFKQFFGTPDQPNKPSRTTVQVAALGGEGTLVEIEAQAVKPHM